MALWSPSGEAYKVALEQKTPPTLAILRIRGSSSRCRLRRHDRRCSILAAGRIEGRPAGTVGNVGIAPTGTASSGF